MAEALIAFPAALVLGFFLPGYLLSAVLGSRELWASAFLISLLVLFYGILVLGVLGVPLGFGSLAVYEVAVCGVGAVAARVWRRRAPSRGRVSLTWEDRALLGAVGVFGTILLLRSALAPLSGFDTYFRWDFLARRMLALGRFDFYPPTTDGAFAEYFYPDGFAPLVSFAYWWIYVSLGTHAPAATSPFVVAQFVAICLVTYRLASVIVSPRAGVLAVGLLTTSPLLFRAVAIGQETGLTALSLTATVYFLASAGRGADPRAMVLAGLATGVGILSREYGWAFLACGVVVGLWLRRSARDVALFVLTALAAGAPWYVRNWIVANNPLYPHNLAAFFDTNPIHTAILAVYWEFFGAIRWPAEEWGSALVSLVRGAPLQVSIGIVGAVLTFRRWRHLSALVLAVGGLWLWSAGYTSGGVDYSTRVLSPAVVILSILAAALLTALPCRPPTQGLCLGLVLLGFTWGVAHAWPFPLAPERATGAMWARAGLAPSPLAVPESLLSDNVGKVLPPGSRILSDNAYAHAALKGTGFDVVAIWSPEVRFIFGPGQDARAVRQRLLERGIVAVLYYPNSLNTRFLERFQFYARDRAFWVPVAELRPLFVLYRLPRD